MLVIMQTVLKRALDLKAITFSESHVQRVLHLIGYAIQEEESGFYPFLKFIDRSNKINLLPALEDLINNPRVESQRDLLLWTVQKLKDVTLKFQDRKMDEDLCSEGKQQTTSLTQVEGERLEKEERAKLAAKRRAQILAQMQNAQKNFMTSNAELFEVNDEEEKGHKSSTMEWATNDESDEQSCIGKNRKTQRIEEARYRCILCSEESAVTKSGECMVYAAFVQKSSVLSRYQQTDEQGQLKYLETSIHPSPHVTTCGHVMHAACFEKYFSNEMVKENRRPYRNRTPVLFDIEKKEFLCPLCRFLSNALLPLLPTLNSFNNIGSAPLSVPDAMDFSSWYTSMDGFIVEFRNANDKQMEVPQNTDEFEERTALFLQVYEEAVIPKLESLVGEPVYTMESISASLWRTVYKIFIVFVWICSCIGHARE
ncbi:hypothetical protein quinque_013923 [Culex quinquefasciatus]